MQKKIIKIILACVLIYISLMMLILNYYNGYTIKDKLEFEYFDITSDSLVLVRMVKDNYKIKFNSNYGLFQTEVLDENNKLKILQFIEDPENQQLDLSSVKFLEYKSHLGIQGHLFSFLYNKLHLSLNALRMICCCILALVIEAICYLIIKKYNILMGIVFYLVFLLSPWIICFAKTLYWIEFTWFLPILFALLLSMNYSKKRIWIPCIFLSIMLKCSCGYEYISTIMLATISFFIFDLLTEKDKNKRKEILKTIIIVGLICLLAFGIIITIHSCIRGNGNIIEGLKDIYNFDIKKRTLFGKAEARELPEVYTPSLEASISSVLEKYFEFKTDIIMGLPGNLFQLLYIITIIILILNIIIKEKNGARDVIMFISFQIATLSWIILAKAHSYFHTHLNYVLWYFGFIQICIYVIIKFILLRLCNLENIMNKLIKRENKKYYLKNFIYKICMGKDDIEKI